MSCDILDHVTYEIRSNKARVTHELDQSIRDAGTTVGQRAIKKLRAVETYKNKQIVANMFVSVQQQY